MILNIIKKLYFARIDEVKGVKALSPEQKLVEAPAEKAISQISVGVEPVKAKGANPGKLLYYAKEENQTGTAKKTVADFEAGIGPEPTKVKVTYVQNLASARGEKKIMIDGQWDPKDNWVNNNSPAYVEILNDFLGAAADGEEGKENNKAKTELDAARIPTEIIAPQDEDAKGRSGIYLAEQGVVQDPKIYAKIQRGIQAIVKSLQERSAMVRAEKGKNVDPWAASDGFAGMRGSGRSNSSWEFTLAHARGIEWAKDPITGKPAVDEEGNILGPIEKTIDEGTLLKATQARVFFEKLASGEIVIARNCKKLKSMVSIVKGRDGGKTKIAYHAHTIDPNEDNDGIVKNAGAPELDAITRIEERCRCKGEKKDQADGCIDEGESPFGSLGRFAYGSQVLNDYVGKMVESLRVAGLLLRMYTSAESREEKKKLYEYVQTVINKAKTDDAILHKAALARLELFETAGVDTKGFADITAIAALEEITDGDRKRLHEIIVRLETEDLAARDPDIVLPVGLIVGNGNRKDNVEAHLTREDARNALINQGVDPKEVDKYLFETSLDQLEEIGADTVYTSMYKEVHSIEGTTPIWGMGLSLKNQLEDVSTKFGEQTRQSQSDLMRLGDEHLTPDQITFREKAYEVLGIKTDAEKRAITKKHKEHDKLKDVVYGLFPGTEWFMDDEEGISVRHTPELAAKRILGIINREMPLETLDGEDNELRSSLITLLEEEDTKTDVGVGRIREKLTRILATHKTHKECNEVYTRNSTLKGHVRGMPTEDALLARKHLAMRVFFTGGSVDEILVSKRGLRTENPKTGKRGTVSIYSQNDALVPVLEGLIDGTWEVKPSPRGELTTHIVEPGTGRHISFVSQGEGEGTGISGEGAGRHTRHEVKIGKAFLEKHLLERNKNLFEGTSLSILLSLMNTQQQLFEELLRQVK